MSDGDGGAAGESGGGVREAELEEKIALQSGEGDKDKIGVVPDMG